MLDEITPQQLEEWIIAYRIGLDRDAWQMAGQIAATVRNSAKIVSNQLASKSTYENELVDYTHFLPDGMVDQKALQELQEQRDRESIARTEPK